MRFFYQNLIDLAGVTFSPSSEQSTLPATNLANEFRARPWRTGTSIAAEFVVMDLGSAKAVTSIILLDHTLTNADTLIKIQGNATNSWGAPSFSQTLTWVSGTIGQVFSTQTYRYWRLIFTKSSASETRDIGRLFLGPYYETEEEPDYEGYDESRADNSKKMKSVSGQTYTDVLPQYCELGLKFSEISTTMADNMRTMIDYVGQSVSFFAQVQTASPLNKFWYVKLDAAFGRKVSGVDASYFWDLKGVNLEEQL